MCQIEAAFRISVEGVGAKRVDSRDWRRRFAEENGRLRERAAMKAERVGPLAPFATMRRAL